MSDDELQGNWRTQLAVIAAMGARPCSGALIVLFFSYVGDYRRANDGLRNCNNY
ncbi:hypothetical protein [Arsenophonus endosymbiont of Aleurodicus floccissimus]|uniref:hypothetical protein n=1 Tax=Arsenophonus endosymbiont of Aleurodicus floccissimus TaxID=2152761 RepID=UPI0016049137|nr:hypothetical protein [Arsenophonus endosymbiont of Aleurodicus floccissimus]